MPEPISPGRRTAVLVTMLLALVLVVAGVSMMNVAVPTLTAALGASPTDQQWIVDGYTVALAALLLPAGAIGDRFGRRRALIAGIAIFGIASAASALSDSASTLIAWRVLTGVGAALIMPGTLSTITSVFPPEGRAKAVGVWAGFAGAGGILGMLVGGAMLEQWWWGSIFVVSSVLAAAALIATLLTVPESRESEHVGLDPLGAVLSVLAIGGLVLGIIEGPSRGWSDPVTLVGIIGGVVAGFLFVGWELRTPAPLLDPRLFKLRGFSTGSTSLFLQFFAIFGFFFISLQYLQLVLGYGTLKSAVALLPIAAVMMPLSTVAASLAERYGQRIIGAAGLMISAVGFVGIATMNASSSYWELLVWLLFVGGGTALAMTPATNAIVGSLPRAKQGVASAVNDTARELGAAFGIAILGSAFNSGYRSQHRRQSPRAYAGRPRRGPRGSGRGDRGRAESRCEWRRARRRGTRRLHGRQSLRDVHGCRAARRRCRLRLRARSTPGDAGRSRRARRRAPGDRRSATRRDPTGAQPARLSGVPPRPLPYLSPGREGERVVRRRLPRSRDRPCHACAAGVGRGPRSARRTGSAPRR